MDILITYTDGENPRNEFTARLISVQRITYKGYNAYDITCFGNEPVRWRNVLTIEITSCGSDAD